MHTHTQRNTAQMSRRVHGEEERRLLACRASDGSLHPPPASRPSSLRAACSTPACSTSASPSRLPPVSPPCCSSVNVYGTDEMQTATCRQTATSRHHPGNIEATSRQTSTQTSTNPAPPVSSATEQTWREEGRQAVGLKRQWAYSGDRPRTLAHQPRVQQTAGRQLPGVRVSPCCLALPLCVEQRPLCQAAQTPCLPVPALDACKTRHVRETRAEDTHLSENTHLSSRSPSHRHTATACAHRMPCIPACIFS